MIPTLQLGAFGRRRVQPAGAGGTISVSWNPADKGANVNLSESDKRATRGSGSAWESVRAMTGKSAGKWQAEFYVVDKGTINGVIVGITKASVSMSGFMAVDANGLGYYGDGQKFTNNAGAAYGNTYTTGDTLTIYFDADNGKLWFAKNGVVQASGDPAAGTNAAFTGLSGTYFPTCGVFTATLSSIRSVPRTYPLATGFSDWV